MKLLFSISILFLVIIHFNINITNAIEITLHGMLYWITDYHNTLAQRTNEYMKAKGLNITLVTIYQSLKNSSAIPSDIANYIEESLLKKEKGYDLYIIDTVYTNTLSRYCEDLNNYVNKDVINLYENGIAKYSCYVDNKDPKKLVGLPFTVDYGGLYANMNLLNKYNRSAPETWDELIDTVNYIYENEKINNPNFNLHKYLAHFPQYENGYVSLIEFIHSFRDSSNDEFPGFSSDNAVAALEKMKEIKEVASTPDEFASNEIAMNEALTNGNFIFLRHWFFNEIIQTPDNYYAFFPLPGKKKGVSASGIGGTNILMNKHISEERKKAAGEVLSYIFSYEQQAFSIKSYRMRSGVNSIYRDKDTCRNNTCDLLLSLQPVVRPSKSLTRYEEYVEKVLELTTKFIYNDTDLSAKEILTKIDDIRILHYIEIDSMVSIVAIVCIVITMVLLIFTFISISYKRYDKHFKFLPYKYWCSIILGLLIISFYCLTCIGELDKYSCIIRPFILSFGFSFIYAPLFLKLVSIFPNGNCATVFVKNHFSMVYILFFVIDIIFNIMWYKLDPLVVDKMLIISGKSYQFCRSVGITGNIIKYLIFSYKLIILFTMTYLIFIEWNISTYKSDIRSIMITIYTNILVMALFIVISRINISNRYTQFALKTMLVLIFCYSVLLVIIGSKFYRIAFKKQIPYRNRHHSSSNNSSSTNLDSSNYYSTNEINNSSNMNSILNYQNHMDLSNLERKPYPTLFVTSMPTSRSGNICSSNLSFQSLDEINYSMESTKNLRNSINKYNYN